jgi:RimJ/RimL family protein N-acetyltransferase
MAKNGKGQQPIHEEAAEQSQKEIKLANGQRVSLRPMTPGDKGAILNFARSLPPDDLLFLRTDITESAVLDEWVLNLEKGATTTIIAEIDGVIAGYASLHHDEARWTRRVGEIRVLLGPAYRAAGLGRRLAEEMFQVGRRSGIKKLAAMMTPDQTRARAAFERLGFQVEALLQDWVVDRDGRSRDLLIMSHDLEALGERLSA